MRDAIHFVHVYMVYNVCELNVELHFTCPLSMFMNTPNKHTQKLTRCEIYTSAPLPISNNLFRQAHIIPTCNWGEWAEHGSLIPYIRLLWVYELHYILIWQACRNQIGFQYLCHAAVAAFAADAYSIPFRLTNNRIIQSCIVARRHICIAYVTKYSCKHT